MRVRHTLGALHCLLTTLVFLKVDIFCEFPFAPLCDLLRREAKLKMAELLPRMCTHSPCEWIY